MNYSSINFRKVYNDPIKLPKKKKYAKIRDIFVFLISTCFLEYDEVRYYYNRHDCNVGALLS